MYKMILKNGKSFNVDSLMDVGGTLEIVFSEGTTYADVASVYDETFSGEYSIDALRRFELIDGKDEIVGVHVGYTEVKNISAFNGVVKVQINKENELKTEVEGLKALIEEQDELIASLVMEVWQ